MAALDQVVLFKTDAEKEGLDLAETYTVTGYPTFALMNADGEVISRWAGYGGPDGFIESLDAGIDDPILITERQARYAENPTERDADVLAAYHATRDEYMEAVELLHTAMRLGDDGHLEYGDRIFTNTAFGYLQGVMGEGEMLFTKEEVVQAADALLAMPDVDDGTTLKVAQLMQLVAGQTGDTSISIPYLKTAVERTEGTEEPWLQRAREGLLVDYTLHVEGDTEKAIRLKHEQMPDGWMEDPTALNSFAWWCFENGINLEEAEAMARKGVALAEPGATKAMILDTAAEICHARGKTDEALELMREAVEEAPGEEHYQRQVTRFEEALAGG